MSISAPCASIEEHFSGVTDPRSGDPVYPLHNILFIAVCAVICGCDDFVAIAKFGRKRKECSCPFSQRLRFSVFFVRERAASDHEGDAFCFGGGKFSFMASSSS